MSDNFDAKTQLYPYTHDYYFGFFKTKSMIQYIKLMESRNELYDFYYFSLALYELCLKKNIKPSKKTAEYILLTTWHKSKRIPKLAKNKNMMYDMDLHMNSIQEGTEEIENTLIEHCDNQTLIKKIHDYVKTKYSYRDYNIFKVFFCERHTVKQMEEILNLKKSSIYQIANRIKKDLQQKFESEYK